MPKKKAIKLHVYFTSSAKRVKRGLLKTLPIVLNKEVSTDLPKLSLKAMEDLNHLRYFAKDQDFRVTLTMKTAGIPEESCFDGQSTTIK